MVNLEAYRRMSVNERINFKVYTITKCLLPQKKGHVYVDSYEYICVPNIQYTAMVADELDVFVDINSESNIYKSSPFPVGWFQRQSQWT